MVRKKKSRRSKIHIFDTYVDRKICRILRRHTVLFLLSPEYVRYLGKGQMQKQQLSLCGAVFPFSASTQINFAAFGDVSK